MPLRALIIYAPSRIHACVFLKWAPAQFNGEQCNSCFMSSNKTSQRPPSDVYRQHDVPPSYFSVIVCRVCLFALVYELLDWMRHQLVDVFGFNVFLRDSRSFKYQIRVRKCFIDITESLRDFKKCIQLERIARLCTFRQGQSGVRSCRRVK